MLPANGTYYGFYVIIMEVKIQIWASFAQIWIKFNFVR